MTQVELGYVIRMRAKPGCGDTLFELSTKYLRMAGVSDHWVKCRQDDDPDVLWTVELFRDEDTKTRYELSPEAAKWRPEILELLAESPMRVPVHPYSASWMQ